MPSVTDREVFNRIKMWLRQIWGNKAYPMFLCLISHKDFLKSRRMLRTSDFKCISTHPKSFLLTFSDQRGVKHCSVIDGDQNLQENQLNAFRDLLMNELNISAEEARNILSGVNNLENSEMSKLKNTLGILKSEGITPDIILKIPSLCWVDSDVLSTRLKYLCSTLDLDTHCVAPLFEMEDVVNDYITYHLSNDLDVLYCNRFHYFSNLFLISLRDSSAWLRHNNFMLSLPAWRIMRQIQFARQIQINLQDILHDPQYFQYSSSFLKNRVKLLNLFDITDIKPWMLSASESHLSSLPTVTRLSWINDFAQILECDRNSIISMSFRWPYFKNIKTEKLERICFVLDREGISRRVVVCCPLIIWHDPKKLAERISLMRAAGFTSQKIETNYSLLVQNKSRFRDTLSQKRKQNV